MLIDRSLEALKTQRDNLPAAIERLARLSGIELAAHAPKGAGA